MQIPLAQTFVKFSGFTYDYTLERIRQDVRAVDGWRLVGYADVKGWGSDEDRVLLTQHTATKDCAIVFEGSQGIADLGSFSKSFGTSYCGFANTHVGVRDELWCITNDKEYKLYIKAKLEKCESVSCVGHSLGGSVCEIFTACANSGRRGDPDYDMIAWTKGISHDLMDEAVYRIVVKRCS